MTAAEALAELEARARPGKAAEMAAYHKAPRRYLGTANPDIDDLAKAWRKTLTRGGRVDLARALWETNIHEARIAAAKLLTQARIKDDEPVWRLIASWVPDFDAWAIADHASIAGQKRLVTDPSRLGEVEAWLDDPSFWVRRATLVMTLPWTRQNHPRPEELATRDRVLSWCARLAPEGEWFLQKAVAWWLRDLSRHDAPRARAWLDTHGDKLKPFARREAARHLPPT
ncbi:MAG: DNA alkylation repair protein [Paracoccaceae bacterium]|nr:DNA alkylation repair protein [Paracoccaceae bacterium]